MTILYCKSNKYFSVVDSLSIDDEEPPKPLVGRDECALSIVIDAEMHLFEFRAEASKLEEKTLEEACWFLRRVCLLVEGDGVLLLLYGEVQLYKEIQEFILELRSAIQKKMVKAGGQTLPLYWDYEGEKMQHLNCDSSDLYCREKMYDSE